ncbi:hypothetical protein OEZ85_014309 [Tetradesmus obliquus]|uniref:starch synthase n=1 Tax=Tetradesmus obliquus TaxID=3088 RepID=A0ABY8U7N9_TETOB|nr:hypothetical protein OEZ85_014309 [Tetradesmus obliquus]
MSVSSKCAGSAGLRQAGVNAVPTPLGARPRLSTLRAGDSSLLRRSCAAQQRPRTRQVSVSAASQLSQAELEELLAENAKLKQLLNSYAHKLKPEQVEKLTKQYEEIAALAAAAGLQLEPLPLPGTPGAPAAPAAAAAAPAAAPAAAAAGSGPAAAAAAPAKPKAVEFADDKVKAWVEKKGDVLSFKFEPNAPKGKSGPAAAAAPAAAAPQAQAKPAAAAPAAAKAPEQPKAAAAAAANGQAPAPAAAASHPPAAASAVANFIQATKSKATAKPTTPQPAAAPAAAAPAAAPAQAGSSSSSSSSSGGKKWRSAMGSDDKAPAAAAAAAPPAAAAAPPAAAAAPAAPKAPAQPPQASSSSSNGAAAQPAAAAAAPPQQAGGLRPPPPPAARAGNLKLTPAPQQQQQQQQQQKPPVQDFTGPTPTSPLFGSSSSSAAPAAAAKAAPPAAAAPSKAPAAASSSSSRPAGSSSSSTAIVDVGPPPPPKKEEPLDIPDPVEKAVAAVKKLTPEEQARRDEAKRVLRANAQKEVDTHDPTKLAATRHSWLIFTVPEKPVAGADIMIYYNRTQSEALRERNRIQATLGYNAWEMNPEQARVDFYPSPIPHVDNSDFWATRFRIPENVYELNFVMTDGESLFDNNNGQDYTYALQAGITWEEWQVQAVERAEAQARAAVEAEEARRAEEAKQAAEEKKKRDRENATKRVTDLKNGFVWLREGGVNKRKVSDDPDAKTWWSVAPTPLVAGKTATLLYNSKAGPLAWIEDKRPKGKVVTSKTMPEGQQVPKLLRGFNNWAIKEQPLPMKFSRITGEEDELWWEVDFEVPKDAACVNFVVNCENGWDNNGGKDHKVAVALPPPYTAETVNEWAESFFEGFLAEETATRLKAEEEAAIRDAKRLKERTEQKEKAKAVLRRQMKHVMFTEPEVIEAGKPVTVYYCPDDTALAGSNQVYFTGGFNRWAHKRQLGPAAMRPPGINGRHWQIRFNVPKDALQLDFVFSNVPGGDGLYDSRSGFDYHLPITGGIGKMPGRLHVVNIAVEMAPVAKVGGLGDVVTALGRAVQEEGHLVEVILPRYDFFLQSPVLAGQMRYETEFDWGGTRIFVSTAIVEGLRCFFIEPRNGFFQTPTVYGRYDDEVRFDFFCKAALEFLLKTGRNPDILHCHDWSTAHVAKSFWEDYQPYGLSKPKVIFTIHNMNYGQKKIAEAANYCQKFTTVSPTYAFEVGSHPAIAGQTHKFMGIRNGIDTELWSPTENKFLPLPYDADTAEEGKRRAREQLRQRVNMSGWQDKPIVAVVSRLTPQKGVHLIKHAAYKALDRGCQFVLLGSAPDPKVQAEFDELANELGHGHVQDAGFVFAYDEPLSHLIYAGADVILVPSNFEPCGLTQMIAMRYGAVPVVRHTGGLRDTVFDVDNDKPRAAWEVVGSSDYLRDKVDETNGFAFEGMDSDGFDYAFNRCIDAYYNDRAWFRALQARVMRQDWSWNRPAIDYVELYYSAIRS